MAHLKCPQCKVVYHGRYALLMDSCPRCLARSREHVRLEATFDGFARPGRYAIDSRELAIGGEPQK